MARKSILIIGGGVAGLSAGIYGQMNGFDTHILEMHTIPGGQCTAWERGGYHFDYCLHWLVGSRRNVFHDIWKETHVLTDQVQVVDSDIYSLTVDENQGSFYIYSNIDRWQEYLTAKAPEDEAAIRKMCGHMKQSVNLEPFEMSPACRNMWDYIRALFLLGNTLWIMLRYGNMPASKYLDSLHFQNESLRFFLMKLFGERKFSALVIIMMLAWFHDKNAGYLVGGSLPIAKRMAQRYRSLGGKLSCGKKVNTILVEDDRAVGVRLTDGHELRADIIISAADGHSTIFDMLGGKYISPILKKAYTTYSLFPPFVQVSFGINAKIQSEAVLTSYWQPPFKLGSMEVCEGYSIMNQSQHDPTLAPPGKTSLIMRIECRWEDWENKGGAGYQEEKLGIARDAEVILEKHYPGIRTKIEVVDVSTPLTGYWYTGVWKGAYEGFLPEGNVMTTTLPDRLPGLTNFYMIGQWVYPGGGLPPAAQSGKWIIQTLCKEEKIRFRVDRGAYRTEAS